MEGRICKIMEMLFAIGHANWTLHLLVSTFKQFEVGVFNHQKKDCRHWHEERSFEQHWKAKENDQRKEGKHTGEDYVLRKGTDAVGVEKGDLVQWGMRGEG